MDYCENLIFMWHHFHSSKHWLYKHTVKLVVQLSSANQALIKSARTLTPGSCEAQPRQSWRYIYVIFFMQYPCQATSYIQVNPHRHGILYAVSMPSYQLHASQPTSAWHSLCCIHAKLQATCKSTHIVHTLSLPSHQLLASQQHYLYPRDCSEIINGGGGSPRFYDLSGGEGHPDFTNSWMESWPDLANHLYPPPSPQWWFLNGLHPSNISIYIQVSPHGIVYKHYIIHKTHCALPPFLSIIHDLQFSQSHRWLVALISPTPFNVNCACWLCMGDWWVLDAGLTMQGSCMAILSFIPLSRSFNATQSCQINHLLFHTFCFMTN